MSLGMHANASSPNVRFPAAGSRSDRRFTLAELSLCITRQGLLSMLPVKGGNMSSSDPIPKAVASEKPKGIQA